MHFTMCRKERMLCHSRKFLQEEKSTDPSGKGKEGKRQPKLYIIMPNSPVFVYNDSLDTFATLFNMCCFIPFKGIIG